MTSQNWSALELVAREGVEQLDAAVQTILQLEELLRAARLSLDNNSGSARLLALGAYVAADHSNGFDDMRANLQKRLNDCLSQKSESAIRGAGGAV